MTKDNKWDAWSIFNECFKPGDDVILIDDEDRISCGKLKGFDDEGCSISRSGSLRETEFHAWLDIEFMCHDGFPVRRLLGADGNDTIYTWRRKSDTRSNIIDILDGSDLHKDHTVELVRGDAFLIQGVKGRLFNPGNHGPQWWDDYFEECLSLSASDGAKALLYNLDNIYHFELQS